MKYRPTAAHQRPQRALHAFRWIVLLVAAVAATAAANPLKTDKGNTIRNLQYFPDGVTSKGIKVLEPGWAKEDGSGPPGKTELYSAGGPEWTAQEKKDINDAIKKAFPNLTVADDPSKVYDCHGLTFKSKKMRIDNDAVDIILKDQGWTPAEDKKHKKGDIVVYRDKAGRVTHSGVVEEVGVDGNASKVRSKWGMLGEYVHAPKDVPAAYGPGFEVRTGGKALADPPLLPEDVDVFHGIQPPPLKASLYDPAVAPVVDGYLSANATPYPLLQGTSHVGFDWQYGLTVPQLGMTIAPGDMLRLYGSGWTQAAVSGLAALGSYGGWQVKAVTSDSVIFAASTSAFVPGDFDGLLTGFEGFSLATKAGAMVYTESVAGSVGLSAGPVPEPASVLLMLVGAALLRWRCQRRLG